MIRYRMFTWPSRDWIALINTCREDVLTHTFSVRYSQNFNADIPFVGQVGEAAEVRVKFQIDVENLQISCEAESSGGCFLLAAEHSNVVGFEQGSEVTLSLFE